MREEQINTFVGRRPNTRTMDTLLLSGKNHIPKSYAPRRRNVRGPSAEAAASAQRLNWGGALTCVCVVHHGTRRGGIVRAGHLLIIYDGITYQTQQIEEPGSRPKKRSSELSAISYIASVDRTDRWRITRADCRQEIACRTQIPGDTHICCTLCSAFESKTRRRPPSPLYAY